MKKILIPIFLTLLFTSCRMHKTNILPEYKKMKDYSELNLTFKVSRLQLENLINDFVPDTLFDANINEDFSFHLKVYKRDITNIKLSGQKISAGLILGIVASKDALFTTASASGTIMLDFSTYLDVDTKWHIISNTTLDGYRWIEKPVIKIAMLKFSPAKILEKLIEYKKEEWMATIDDFIYENDFVAQKLDSLLQYFQKPYPLDTFKVTGMLIRPVSTSFAPFYSDMDSIYGGMQLRLNLDIVLMDGFEQAVTKIQKPVFSWDYSESISQSESIIAIKLHKSKMEKILNEYLDSLPDNDKIFKVKGKKIKLDKINVDIVQGNMNMVTYFSGDAKGVLMLSAYPQWDYKHKKLILTDVQTSIKINNFGAKIILSLFKNTVKNKVIHEIENYINDMIKYIIDGINAQLNNEESKMKLKIRDYDIPVGIEDESLLLNIKLKISGKVEVKNLVVEL